MKLAENVVYPVMVTKKFLAIIQKHILNVVPKECGMITVSFRDPDYSAEEGGYHPVEVAVDQNGKVMYVTDFAFFGCPPFCELAKCMDFDFREGRYQDAHSYQPIATARSLYRVFQMNFCSYYDWNIFEVTVTAE